MLTPLANPFRKRRGAGGGPHRPPAPAPPVPLTLVAAACSEAPTLVLTFDRPIDVSGLVPGLLRVDNGLLGFSYVGYDTPTLTGPATVEVQLTGVEEYPGTGVRLTAAAGNGIVAVDDGGVWAGVVDLSLPYP